MHAVHELRIPYLFYLYNLIGELEDVISYVVYFHTYLFPGLIRHKKYQ
jgi:hypothetical protein